MRHFYQILTVFLFTLNLSCSSPKEDPTRFQELKITESDIAPFDEVVNEIAFIPFIIPEENPLKLNTRDPKLLVEDYIYFSTGSFDDASIHVFEHNGQYIQTFKKQGDGPEEYQYILGLDMIDGHLAIWDQKGNFKFYDKESFDFVGSKSLANTGLKYISQYQYLGNEKWILVNDFAGEVDENNYYNVFYLLNEKTEESKPLSAKTRIFTSNIIQGQIAELSDDSYMLNFGGSDTLFHFSSDSIQPWVRLNLADKNIPEDEKLNPEKLYEKIVFQQAYNFNFGQILSGEDILRISIFGIKHSEIVENNIHSIPVQHLYIQYPSKEYTMTKSFGAFEGKGYSNNGFFYEILHTEDVQNYLDDNYFGKYTEQLEAAVEKLVDKEDPILLRYNVKIR
ncbi:6-bladed beta-propeller [Belliella marina]|uniref:6-bladed beta-propeller n=1 Tax=Belliella marina TaxID=1644146 RepID=A0ABW4VH10_9BACT